MGKERDGSEQLERVKKNMGELIIIFLKFFCDS